MQKKRRRGVYVKQNCWAFEQEYNLKGREVERNL